MTSTWTSTQHQHQQNGNDKRETGLKILISITTSIYDPEGMILPLSHIFNNSNDTSTVYKLWKYSELFDIEIEEESRREKKLQLCFYLLSSRMQKKNLNY